LRTQEGLDFVPYCRAIVVVLIVVGGLILIARMVRQLAQQQAERRDVQRESLWSDQDLAAGLRNSLMQGLNQLRALAGQLGGQHRRSAASIRKMYASMADLASKAGYPRRPAQTPYEYRGTLHRAFPGGQDAVDAITEAYVRVHYGQVPGTQDEMGQLLASWERVQTLVVPKAKEGDA
jgi:ribonuclease D